MNRRQFKERVAALMNEDVANVSWADKVYIAKQTINHLERGQEFDVSNKGNPWTDDELRLVLKTAPTKENALLLAKAFKRGYGSIEQILRWAVEDQSVIDQKRPEDSFIKQIKRIAKEVWWRAT
jgi:hypothetical protein